MGKRVRVHMNAVADAINKRDRLPERIIEFGWNDPKTNQLQGGLICFSPNSTGDLRMDVYQLDHVKVNINQADSLKMAMILSGMEEFIIHAIGDEGAVARDRYREAADLLRKGLIEPWNNDTEYTLSPTGKYLYQESQGKAPKKPQKIETRKFIYAPFNRPGVWPEGGRGVEKMEGFDSFDLGYGFVVYDRQLTFDDLYNYQLAPVSHDAWPFKIGNPVVVNEVDEAVVWGYLPRHQYIVLFTAPELNKLHTVVSWRDIEGGTL